MNDKNEKMLDELMDNELPDLAEIDDELFDVSPWHRPVSMITWGIGLTTVTLNFMYLNYILPTIGMALMLLGFRTLRKENKCFFAAWVLAIVRMAALLCSLTLDATPVLTDSLFLALPLCFIQLLQLAFFYSAVNKTYKKAGVDGKCTPILWLIVFVSLFIFFGLFFPGESLLYLPVLIIYIAIIISLRNITKKMTITGYVLKNAPVRVGNTPLFWCLMSAAVILIAVTTIAVTYSAPNGVEWNGYGDSELRAELVSAGFPEDILSIIPEDEIAGFADTVKIEANTQTKVFSDDSELRMDTVYVEISDRKIYVVQYFEWLDGGVKSNDGFDIWLDNDSMNITLIGGALLYEKSGMAYRSDIPELTCSTQVSSPFGTVTRNSVDGTVSYPLGAEHQRGYVIYSYEYTQYRAIVCGSLDYLHRKFFTYPYVSPARQILTGNYNFFNMEQNYTTFYTYGEYYDLIERGLAGDNQSGGYSIYTGDGCESKPATVIP